MKKGWKTPKLMVMHRSESQEAVLDSCKCSGGQTNAYNSGCFDIPECQLITKCKAGTSN